MALNPSQLQSLQRLLASMPPQQQIEFIRQVQAHQQQQQKPKQSGASKALGYAGKANDLYDVYEKGAEVAKTGEVASSASPDPYSAAAMAAFKGISQAGQGGLTDEERAKILSHQAQLGVADYFTGGTASQLDKFAQEKWGGTYNKARELQDTLSPEKAQMDKELQAAIGIGRGLKEGDAKGVAKAGANFGKDYAKNQALMATFGPMGAGAINSKVLGNSKAANYGTRAGMAMATGGLSEIPGLTGGGKDWYAINRAQWESPLKEMGVIDEQGNMSGSNYKYGSGNFKEQEGSGEAYSLGNVFGTALGADNKKERETLATQFGNAAMASGDIKGFYNNKMKELGLTQDQIQEKINLGRANKYISDEDANVFSGTAKTLGGAATGQPNLPTGPQGQGMQFRSPGGFLGSAYDGSLESIKPFQQPQGPRRGWSPSAGKYVTFK